MAEDRRDCYWLYVVTDCSDSPKLAEPIADPARIDWHEVVKVQHYWLEVHSRHRPLGIADDRGAFAAVPSERPAAD